MNKHLAAMSALYEWDSEGVDWDKQLLNPTFYNLIEELRKSNVLPIRLDKAFYSRSEYVRCYGKQSQGNN